MDDLYRDEILEHYRNPHNFGTLDEPTTVKEGANPLCGDRITLMLGIDESGHVNDVKFTGRGCAISQASASILTSLIAGKLLVEVNQLTSGELLEAIGIGAGSARVECALLSLRVLRVGLNGPDYIPDE